MTINFAIVLFGQLRTFQNKLIGESYKKFLSSFKSIDLYIICWDKRGFSANHGEVNITEKLRDKEKITISEIEEYYSQFEFFNIINIQLYNFDEVIEFWSQEHKDIYQKPFSYHCNVTTSLPVEFMIQSGSRLIYSPDQYQQIYFMRPDTMIIHPLDFNSDTILKDNVFYSNTVDSRCIDHGFFMNGITLVALNDLFDQYLENMKNCQGSDPYFNKKDDIRDNNHLIAFHLKSKGVTLSHKAVQIFNIIR